VIGNAKAGHVSPASGNEGVGEHVRTGSRPGFGPGEIAELVSAPNEENLFLLPDPFSRDENSIQPFDLMSRRHPLSSTRAVRLKRLFQKADRLRALVTCRLQAAGILSGEIYFFFLTLRVFFAVFFTALFAFFAFLAFLAMLPS
jgi:hypothetical protein